MSKKNAAESSSKLSSVSHVADTALYEDSEPALEDMQELFLPVHGHVELFPEELAIVDHPAFQRLRRVRQLGLAHMVFPGATHTRFEHSIGAVHVAQLIIDHVNKNFRRKTNKHPLWRMVKIDFETARFIRLASLLHDIGHLPLGHTLEDELRHLPSHDGPARLERVAKVTYPEYKVDRALSPERETTDGGWTLEGLVNRLYKPFAEKLGIKDLHAFTILSHIVCKPPKDVEKKKSWDQEAEKLGSDIMLRVCQDIVGNTICADFLDYLHRDLYHLGKPLYFDLRIYQYMEVLQPISADEERGMAPRFVISVGTPEKIRHDALTDILDLLNARYKLAQTVLFHRTKLALTGLLDRCLLEIGDFYQKVGLGAEKFHKIAESLLLDSSDDGVAAVLAQLAQGGDSEGRQIILDRVTKEKAVVQQQVSANPQASLIDGRLNEAVASDNPSTSQPIVRGPLTSQKDLILGLVNKLRDREVYSLVYKLRMSDFTAPHSPENPRLKKLLALYKDPKKRMEFLRGMEALCEYPRGSFVMNCPFDPAMNAKVANVSLFVEGDVSPFAEYEKKQGESTSLTRGALWSQINRFYELWAAVIYLDREIWERLSDVQQQHLKSVLKSFLFRDADTDPQIIRMHMQPSLDVLRLRASQKGTVDPAMEQWKDFIFPSGLPFREPKG